MSDWTVYLSGEIHTDWRATSVGNWFGQRHGARRSRRMPAARLLGWIRRWPDWRPPASLPSEKIDPAVPARPWLPVLQNPITP